MQFQLPKEVNNILETFLKAHFQIYVVGGAVRDLIMDRKVSDWDFTTDATPEEILKIFPEGFSDNKFGTVGIPMKDTSGVSFGSPEVGVLEITTMRKEGVYKDFRHPTEVSWTNKIEEDLARRDLTINSMAFSSEEDIIDPFGGQQDLKNRLIKAVGDPNKRFQEDALRLMRAIRIASELEFEIESRTYQAIKQNAHLIKEVAPERIKEELFKLLISADSFKGITQLQETGILPILFPELQKNFGVMQEGPKHARIYDIGEHSFLTLKYTLSNDPITKLAALLHDIGKPETYKLDASGNVTFYQHEVVGAHLALKIAKRFNLSKKETEKLFKLIRWHLFTVDENQTDSAIRRFIKNVGLENIDDMMAIRVGDRLGGGTERPTSWRTEKFKERIKQVLQKPFSISDLKVSGNDVMKVLGIPTGPKVGEILEKLFKEVLKDASKNNKEYLLEKIKSLK